MKHFLMGNGNKRSKKNNENIVPNSQETIVSDAEVRSRYQEHRAGSTGYEREKMVEVSS